jgi:3-dehydroquinate synthetase
VQMPQMDTRRLMQAMVHDKKVRQDRITFVLLKDIGETFITDDIAPALVEEVLSGG